MDQKKSKKPQKKQPSARHKKATVGAPVRQRGAFGNGAPNDCPTSNCD